MNLVEAERLLGASANYRLLRRLALSHERLRNDATGETRRAVFLDTETTGLDLEHDEVIELALLPFEYEHATGRIVRVDEERAFAGLRQPSFSIPAEVSRIHGITDADVAGRAIDPERVREIVEDAHLIIAHNAAFDRPMVEKHWPIFETKHWACSLVDIDWRSEGLATAKLDNLLMRQGWFHSEHRAMSDAEAGLFLLSLPCPSRNAWRWPRCSTPRGAPCARCAPTTRPMPCARR